MRNQGGPEALRLRLAWHSDPKIAITSKVDRTDL